jgi:6-phosphofructokinase
MSERIGIVTGGDCPGLNAVIRAVAKAAAKRGWETIGFLGGYEGILEPERYMTLDYQKLGGLLTRGGTILTGHRGRQDRATTQSGSVAHRRFSAHVRRGIELADQQLLRNPAVSAHAAILKGIVPSRKLALTVRSTA